MPTLSLPPDPDLRQLRRQARDLQRGVRAGHPTALRLLETQGESPAGVRRSDAQRVLARAYGFASWPRLVHHVETVTAWRRSPDQVGVCADPGAEFLRLACLTYGSDDGPDRLRRAGLLLAEDPSLGGVSVWTAAATADVAALRARLAEDPSLARREGGPFGWVPLLYLAYARHDASLSTDRVLACVDLLLAAGGDPNAGFLWHGSPPPFTALTGALGGGEGDQAPHPAGFPLARRLLAAGADPNDGQALYHQMLGSDDDQLRLLFEFGLGSGDGGPWRRRLGTPAPAELLRTQLRWAVDHSLVDRVRLLAEHGVDLAAPFTEPGYGETTGSGLTPVELAARHGDLDLVGVLMGLGAASSVTLGPAESLVAAVLRGSEPEARSILRGDRWQERGVSIDDAAVLAAARAARPGLVVQAAAAGRADAVRLAVELGFDADARGRSDTPSDQPWETGLHAAVAHDHADVVSLLLALGADPTVRDARFDATPRGWAEHLGKPEIAVLFPPE